MCGFSGFCNLKRNISSKENIYNMNKCLANRGPDENGYYYEENVVFGHNRLAIVDPQGGKQPMTTRFMNNTFTIVHNG